jgi:hypothetical protein
MDELTIDERSMDELTSGEKKKFKRSMDELTSDERSMDEFDKKKRFKMGENPNELVNSFLDLKILGGNLNKSNSMTTNKIKRYCNKLKEYHRVSKRTGGAADFCLI